MLRRGSWRERGEGKSEGEGWRRRVVDEGVIGEGEMARGKVSWIVLSWDPQEVAGGSELGDGVGKGAEELGTDGLVGARGEGGGREEGRGGV